MPFVVIVFLPEIHRELGFYFGYVQRAEGGSWLVDAAPFLSAMVWFALGWALIRRLNPRLEVVVPGTGPGRAVAARRGPTTAPTVGIRLEHRLVVIGNRAALCLTAGSLAVFFAATASAEQDAESFFASLRQAYSERSFYADVGQIEITEDYDGVEETRLHFFETTASRGAGLVWRVMIDSDRGFEDRTVWLAGQSTMVYDGALRQTKPTRSMATGVEEVLGRAAGRAVLVPTLLDFGVGSAALDALASAGSLGEPESCFDGRECRVVSAPLAGDGEIRVTVESGTFWIHDVEVLVREEDAAGGPTSTTVRVSHSPSALDDGIAESRLSFAPPATTRDVLEWQRLEPRTSDSTPLGAGFFDEITVDVFTVAARIVTRAGYPLLDLEPGELIATVGALELPVTALDWYGTSPESAVSARSSGPMLEPVAVDAASAEKTEQPGRLILIFLQNDFEPTRVKGHMKLYPGLRQLVDNLGPVDRVAVLSFFGHLKLWRDFTTDHQAVKDSLERAFFPGARPSRLEPSRGVSLAAYFDQDAARDVADSVEALRFTSEALAQLPGDKQIVFFGYGLEGGDVTPMLRSLQRARATTFVIDTTQADFHTLGAGLQTLAAATGGTYQSSYAFAGQAVNRIERMLAGYYVITIDRSATPEARGKLEIRLRDKDGTVLMVPSGLG